MLNGKAAISPDLALRLEQAGTDQTIDTPAGPLRATAGIRVRMGGLDTRATPQVKPVNPGRKTPATLNSVPARPLVFDLLDDMGAWIATAEMPGVVLSDLVLSVEGEDLVVRATGERPYLGRIKMPVTCGAGAVGTMLNNGILTLNFPQAPE